MAEIRKAHIKGYKKCGIEDGGIFDVKVFDRDYDAKKEQKTLQEIFIENDLESLSISKVQEEPMLLNVSDIDTSNTVYFELSNPYYVGDECNVMETSFEFPSERIHIIHIIKLAVRCGLQIKFHSENKQAEEWVSNYFEYYRS